jgi:hypothetical protein
MTAMWNVHYRDRQDGRETTSWTVSTREDVLSLARKYSLQGHQILCISGPAESDKIEGKQLDSLLRATDDLGR